MSNLTGQIANHAYFAGCCAMPPNRHSPITDADNPVPAWDPQPGDVVRLRSGGSSMTVIARGRWANEEGAGVSVAWLDDQNRPHSAMYPLAALKRY